MNNNNEKRRVVIVAMTANMLTDFAGPSDVFTNANVCLQAAGSVEGYEVLIAAPTIDRTVRAMTGVEIRCPYHAMEIALPIDTLIIAGNDFREASAVALEDFYHWLAQSSTTNAR